MIPRAAVVVVVALLLCPNALADADPASDVLLAADAFYPYSPPVSSSLQSTLNTELVAAHKAHFPIKVALIATPTDLGAIPELYGKPRQYAAFLDQEISFAGKVPLLVVMPDGYGSAGLGSPADAVVASLRKPPGRTGDGLTQAAISAVPKLAAASGHPLGHSSVPPAGHPLGHSSVPTGGGTSDVVPLAILVAVCAGLPAPILALRRRRARTTPPRRSRR